MREFVFTPCQPPIADIFFGEQEDPAISEQMQALFTADQAARQAEPIDWSHLSVEDEQRPIPCTPANGSAARGSPPTQRRS